MLKDYMKIIFKRGILSIRDKYKIIGIFDDFMMTAIRAVVGVTFMAVYVPHVNPKIIALSTLIGSLVMFGLQCVMRSEKIRNFLRPFVMQLILINYVIIITISIVLIGIEWSNQRWLLFAIFSGIGEVVVHTLYQDMVNDRFSGNELTTYRADQRTAAFGAGIVGGLFASIITLSIEWAISVLCGYLIISACLDYYRLGMLKQIPKQIVVKEESVK